MAYLVVDQFVSVDGQDCKTFVCGTIAEARKVLAERWQLWQLIGQGSLSLCNGFTPSTLPAAAVATNTRRYGRCMVAKAYLKGGSAEIGILVY